jgi:hypothetical protein
MDTGALQRFVDQHVDTPIEEAFATFNKSGFFDKESLAKIHNEIKRVEMERQAKKEFLNCVMYRIIDRGGNRIGPHRALKFALEFNLDPAIPIMYGHDGGDPDLRDFMNKGLKAGVSVDTKIIKYYFLRQSFEHHFDLTDLKQVLIDTQDNYTEEEKQLHYQLTDLIKIRLQILKDEKYNNANESYTKKYIKEYKDKYEINDRD